MVGTGIGILLYSRRRVMSDGKVMRVNEFGLPWLNGIE